MGGVGKVSTPPPHNWQTFCLGVNSKFHQGGKSKSPLPIPMYELNVLIKYLHFYSIFILFLWVQFLMGAILHGWNSMGATLHGRNSAWAQSWWNQRTQRIGTRDRLFLLTYNLKSAFCKCKVLLRTGTVIVALLCSVDNKQKYTVLLRPWQSFQIKHAMMSL